MRRIGGHREHVDAIVVTGDGKYLVSRGYGGELVRWDLEHGNSCELAQLRGGRGLALAPAGWLVVGAETKPVRVEIDGGGTSDFGETDAPWDDGIQGVISCAVSLDGRLVACAGGQNLVEVRDLDGNLVWQGQTYKWPYVVRFLPDGQVAVGTWDGELSTSPPVGWDGEPVDISHPEFDYPGGPIFDIAVVPNGDTVIVGADGAGSGGWIKVWRPAEKRYVAESARPRGVHAIALSPNGRHLVAGGNGQALELLSPEDLKPLGTFALEFPTLQAAKKGRSVLDWYDSAGPATVRSVAWHPDGSRAYAGCEDGAIVEIGVEEMERRGAIIDEVGLWRSMKHLDAVLAQQERIRELLNEGKSDPLAAIAKLEIEAPEIHAQLIERLHAQIGELSQQPPPAKKK